MRLYIHIPFCRSKCGYCSFYSLPGVDASAMDAYVDLLVREIALWDRRLQLTPTKRSVTSIYFGGGTPSLLSLDQLQRIADALRGAFHWTPELEWSLEANPDSAADLDYLRGLLGLGVNRLSLGLQSLDNRKLDLLGRRHQSAQGLKAVDLARCAGFGNISLDLIWGLPGQRALEWLRELETVLKLQPEHLSCYGLTLEHDTPLAQAESSGNIVLPTETEQAKMFLQGTELLESKGYLQYEISNYSRMGFTCRHNEGYWKSESYLGLGAGAVSTLGDRRWENPKDLDEYAGLVRAERIGTNAVILTRTDRIKELVMLSLRTTRGLNLKDYSTISGRDFLQQHRRLIQVLRQNELIRVHSGFVRFTKSGMLVSNSILERFIDATSDVSSADT
ncbi:oxygen-independent coproporphyrinogen-3 oxidase [Desulfonatronum thiosulfatophilum]|uniref:Heme chaperone HemW n=1 Tax=Desulfonatronum thiosulfatophilum TaxID=617002 RepID=A0A1G6DRK4_9BACT|nr:radical SAM family heme chaperone HemW [Desulfonatronum thiosulfatophilum]SDB47730.1 oxygen-independent coproporphyrinogen-3 oxidase [Desulfonatronum thiosulfatophilum]